MKTLFLDSSTPYVRTALVDGDRVLGEMSFVSRPLKGLHQQIEKLLQATETDVTEVECVAVSIGPGSWTGIHIALTTARTLAQVLHLPLLPLSQLELIAWENWSHDRVLTMIDARHSHAYCQFFRFEGGKPFPVSPPTKRPSMDALDEAVQTGPFAVAGSGFQQDVAGFVRRLGKNAQEGRHIVTASTIARAVSARLSQTLLGDDMLALEPQYLIPEGEGPQAGAWKR